MWSEAASLRFIWRALMTGTLAIASLITSPVVEAQVASTSWSIVGNTPNAGGIAQAVLGYNNFFLIVRQTETQARPDTWLYQIGGTESESQLRSVGSLLTPPIRFEQGVALTWDENRFIYALIGANYNTRNRVGFLRYDTCLNQSQSCANSWMFLENTPVEQGPGNALAFARVNNREYVYAFLGSSTAERAGAVNTFTRYDIANNRWERLNRPPTWVCTDDGAALEWDRGTFIYALNGSDCNDRATTRVSRFPVTTTGGTWQPVNSIPTAVDMGGSLVYDNNGGLIALSGAGISLPAGRGEEAFRFDLTSLQWTQLDDLPCAVGGFAGERLGLVGGSVIAWQGHELTAQCGGTALMRYEP